ncbi:hypothetical protein B0T24DRAFT_665847 [Lasiosphaeria ovina]|uniref:Uncharacterized protein n=1 Tax=Lasiosphaeria ovina TaxID=92902 RepID=A0AAE0NBY3_9PEZI|nr:hypothetical protein B0T24DRAFT_665847 [Lasiosphaeria ovina]
MESDASSHYAKGVFLTNIDSLSKRSSKDHPYPRPDLINLNQYLSNFTPYRSQVDFPETGAAAVENDEAGNDFALSHDIGFGNAVRFPASMTGLAEFSAHGAAEGPSLLFLRGFASPQWLTAIGKIYNPSPELYRRHLDFPSIVSGNRDLHSSPSLPSSSARVFQLTIPTICTRNVDVSGYEPEDLQQARNVESEAMIKYFQQLRAKGKVADSVVRKCLLLSQQEYVVEQTVTVELDSGNDLSESIQGPWNPRPDTRAWETYFFPVIVHHHHWHHNHDTADLARYRSGGKRPGPREPRRHSSGVGLTPAKASLSHSRNNNRSSSSSSRRKSGDEWRAAQNISQLPFQYGSCLDRDLARHDALYALSELFRFAASAELQFLSLLQKRIEREVSFVGAKGVDLQGGGSDSVVLLNLKYLKTQLTSHAQSLAETTARILRNRRSPDWPRVFDAAAAAAGGFRGDDDDGGGGGNGNVSPPAAVEMAEKTAVLLLADFEYLLQRADALARECEHGMTTLANSSVLQESRRSADLAMTVQKLTIISTIFIPLSFVSSVWGMNFQELGSGNQPIWMLSATAVPIVLVAYMLYQWDTITMFYHKIRSSRGTRAAMGA